MPTVYKITPVSKPRQTQRDRWKKRPVVLRYHAYKDELRLRRVKLPECHHVTFILPMPPSWSKKKQEALYGQPHRQRPDADNLLKGLWDALYEEDSHIWDCRVTKIWGTEGMIKVEGLS